MARRIGYLGGSFDPIHLGHLILARFALEGAELDRVVLLVAGRPPHKEDRSLAPASDRVAMARAATDADPRLEVDDRETRREGPAYTIDTIRELRAERPEDQHLWIIGADSLSELPSWKSSRELLDLATVVTAARPGIDVARALESLEPVFGPDRTASLARNVVPMPPVGISSTVIRRRVGEGRSIRYLVPDAVRDYVRTHGLYRD